MPSIFAVTASSKTIPLDGGGRGEVTFTYANNSGRLVRSQLRIQPLGLAKADWLAIVGEPERDLPADAVHQVTVRIAVPLPATASGRFSFQARVVDLDKTDENYSDSPVVSFEIPADGPPPPHRWWIWAVLAGLLLVVGMAAALVLLRKPGLNKACPKGECRDGLACVEGFCKGEPGYPGCTEGSDCVLGACGSDGACEKPGLGQSCKTFGCADQLACVNEVCLGKVDQPCWNGQCASPFCRRGKCVADTLREACDGQQDCMATQSCFTNLCLGNVGQPCADGKGCASGFCQGACQLAPEGASCSASSQCQTSYCLGGRCFRPRGSGEACFRDEQCGAGCSACRDRKCTIVSPMCIVGTVLANPGRVLVPR